MSKHSVLIVSGTNRPGSNALKIAQILQGHYQTQQAAVSLFSLAELPAEMFAPTAYAAKPPAVMELQRRILDGGGLHIVSPEYNGSFPGVLKYFIDMLKFPESFEHKPVAFIGVSNGMWGALRAVEHLQGIFGYRNAHCFPDRIFIPGIAAKLGPSGELLDPSLDERIAKQAAGFANFIHKLCAGTSD